MSMAEAAGFDNLEERTKVAEDLATFVRRASARCWSKEVRDLTDKMNVAGRLTSEVPDRHWLVLR